MMKMTKKKVTILLKEMVDALASMVKAKSLSLSLQTRISALKLRLMLFSLFRDRRFQVGTIPNNLHSLLNRRRRNHRHNNNKLEQQKHEQQMLPILNDETQFHSDAEDDKRIVLFYCDDGDSGKSEASVVVNYCDGKSDAGASNLGLAEANRVDTEPEEEVNPVSEEWLEEAAVATAAELGEEEEEEVLEGDAGKVLDELEFVVEDGGDRDNVADKVFDELKLGDNPTASGSAVHQVVNEIEAESDGGSGGDWLQKSTVEEEEFELEDEIDQVADLFIKRFHEQMRMERSPIHEQIRMGRSPIHH